MAMSNKKNIEHKNIPRHKPCLSSSVLQQRPTNTECECVRGDDNNINNNDNNINTAGNDAGLRVVPLPSAGRRPQISSSQIHLNILNNILYLASFAAAPRRWRYELYTQPWEGGGGGLSL